MTPQLRKPAAADRLSALRAVEALPLTYWERGGTGFARMPHGYRHDEYSEVLGHGEAVYASAKRAINAWAMFPGGWTDVLPSPARGADELPVVGDQAHLAFRLLGAWWTAPARVVYTVDERDAYGFAYGTLPGHPAQGEELFAVERDAEGAVRYRVRAMSRPHWWGARVARHFMRAQQARFRRESGAAMRAYVAEALAGGRYSSKPGILHPITTKRLSTTSTWTAPSPS